MTHDELLAKLAPAYIGKWDWNTRTDALRAVVELHKPIKGVCSSCQDDTLDDYPCLTIQAIEKELG